MRPYLRVTYRRGRPFAAYLYLPRQTDARPARTEEARPGVLVDYDAADRPIGLEITAPGHVGPDAIQEVLAELGIDRVSPEDLAPLRAA